MKTRESVPVRVSKTSGATPRATASQSQSVRRSRQDEADIAVSESLIRREKPIPLKKILKEFGR